jgi:hypothetical protein
VLFESVQEVVGVLLADVLNSKVLYHQGEGYRTRFVTPQVVCVFDGVVTMMLIPQVRPAHKYPISPWEMIHLPVEDNALCAPPYTVYKAVCNKSLIATYQYKISNPSNKVLVNNN